MFEMNDNKNIKKIFIEKDNFIQIIDNFYKNPDEILNFFLNCQPNFHKIKEYPSFNSIYFEDKRHKIQCKELSKIYEFLSKMCNQKSYDNELLLTNFSRFKKDNHFNDYLNNYWWPHVDNGYNAIIYFNKNDFISGTNLYENLNPNEEPPNCPEHYAPWRSKNNYKLIYSIKPKYNRLVLFDGYKYTHGMDICNDDYFHEEYRMNQVLFFNRHNTLDNPE
jgi:hypothetical protein